MKVLGIEITDDQIAAGLAAMTGKFKASDVRRALANAGVPTFPEPYALDRTADRLLQSERKAGRIRAINNKNWERLS